jgi:hypothetical protein
MVKIKAKGKLTKHHAMKAYWEVEVSATYSLHLHWHYMKVSGQLHALTTVPQGKEFLVPAG